MATEISGNMFVYEAKFALGMLPPKRSQNDKMIAKLANRTSPSNCMYLIGLLGPLEPMEIHPCCQGNPTQHDGFHHEGNLSSLSMYT